MKTVVEFVAKSWNDTQPLTPRRSWRIIIAMDYPPQQTKSVRNVIPIVLANAQQEVDEHDTICPPIPFLSVLHLNGVLFGMGLEFVFKANK